MKILDSTMDWLLEEDNPPVRYLTLKNLLGMSARNFPELPDIFSGGPIVSRLGRDAIQSVPMLEDMDVEPFIEKIIGFLRNPDTDFDALITEAKNATNEDVPQNFFPFTQEAIEAIKVSVGQEMTPREITLKMTRSVGKAHNYDKPVITSDLID